MPPKFYTSIGELPELEGWNTVNQIAKLYKVSRQRVNQWIQEGKFPGVHRISEVLIVSDLELDTFDAGRSGRSVRATPRVEADGLF